MVSLTKILEKRDRWSISVYRYDRAADIFSGPPDGLVHSLGERGLRFGKSYQSVVADPFLLNFGGKLYLFYEVKTDHGHGSIHAQSMSDDGFWHDLGAVLVEPFHLSYPQVFVLQDRIFMIPEAAQSGAVRLYEAEDFPHRWREKAILIDAPMRDPTLLITQDEGLLLLATTAEYELKLFHADAIEGPFKDTGIIITNDRSRSRCAGRIFKLGNHLLRPAQDCSTVYGERIYFQEIFRAISLGYHEDRSELMLRLPSGLWMSRGSHHFSCENFGSSFFVAVDGRGPDLRVNSLMLGVIRLGSLLYQKLDFGLSD